VLQRPGAIIAGKYQIERPLARGGVGTVWVARHTQLQHEVAVKFLDPKVAASPQVRQRFEREARAAAHLRTPHVVQVFDYGVEEDTPYLVMELLHGETLHQRLRRETRLSMLEMYGILVQIGKGLRRAHEVGFVHRDLKPANLYLARNDDDESIVKILDFGIAKEIGGEVGESTRTGELIGSPHFMSPEQIRGEREVDARSDLWALGVILYRAITGHLPFPGEVLTAVITKIVVEPIPNARQHLPDAPESLDAFFEMALQRDRNRRFQTVADLVRAFGEVAAETAGIPASQILSPGLLASRPSLGSIPDVGSMSGGSTSIPGLSSSGTFRPPPQPSVSHLEALVAGSYPGGAPSSAPPAPGAPAPTPKPPTRPPPPARSAPPRPAPPRPPPPARSSQPGVTGRSALPSSPDGAGGSLPGSGPVTATPPSGPTTMMSPGTGAAPSPVAVAPEPVASPAPVISAPPPSFPGVPADPAGPAMPFSLEPVSPPSGPPMAGTASSPGTLLPSETSPGARPRRSSWILVAAGLAIVVVGVAIGALRMRPGPAASAPGDAPTGRSSAGDAARPAPPPATATAAPAASDSAAPAASDSAAPAASDSAAPVASNSVAPAASDSAPPVVSASATASPKPRATSGGKARPPGKKPVDTID
jgi:serine/threonine-protein kinase